jgi:hypothetical protein
MKNFKLFAAIIVCALASSCHLFDEKIQWKKIERESYTLMVPDFMTEQSDLHEEANLQFAQVVKEVYVVVIEEPTADFETIFMDTTLGYPPTMQGYSDLMYEQFQENLGTDLVQISEREVQKNPGLERHTFNSTAKVEGIDAYYEFGIIRTDSSYYQIIAWTLAKNKDKYASCLQEMVKSLEPKKP